MNDKKSTDARREHLERHTRIGVMLDRLATAWDVCLFDAESGQYDNVDKAAKDELVDELRWLRDLYTEAIASDGDVRAYLMGREEQPPSQSPTKPTHNVQ